MLLHFSKCLDSCEILSSNRLFQGALTRTRRQFLKIAAAGLVSSTAPEILMPKHEPFTGSSAEISIWVTSGTKRFQRKDPLRWQTSGKEPETETIELNPAQRSQEILGFGAAFTDASCYMLQQLSEDARAKLFHELFHPSEMALSVCRTCIGASDYSTELFGYDEGEPDPELKRFSIDHDKTYILPTLREARKANPDMFLFSSPWSPPGWMKSNNSMLGGCIRKTYFSSYAQHFVKFLQAYAAEGVAIQAITSQNEVDTDQDCRMPASIWGQEYEIEFVSRHLGPALTRAGLSTRIWLLDHNYNLWGRVICSLDDPELRKYCSAVAWHGYVGTADMMSKAHATHPDVTMHWTEGGPDYTNPRYATDWTVWARSFCDALGNWCSSITGWNLALDERGRPNLGPFNCGGLVTIHSESKEITRSGQYWALAHFSRAIRRGAHRFASATQSPNLNHFACENPDGQKVLVIVNLEAARTVAVRLGAKVVSVPLESDSVSTLTWSS
jgi:glucosylceramidase